MQEYNLQQLKEQCGEDKAFFNEMLDTFASTAREGIQQMKIAVNAGDFGSLQQYAHKIVSPFRHIEADTLVKKIKEVERLAQEQKDCSTQVSEVESETERLLSSLKKEYLH